MAFGLADKTIHVPSGLTYDQLMLNQMQGKLAVDYISSVTDGIKKQIEKWGRFLFLLTCSCENRKTIFKGNWK